MVRQLAQIALIPLLAGCNVHQSTLTTFGADAREIRQIALVLVSGALAILLGMAALYWRAVRSPEGSMDHRGGMRLVLWFGAIGPAIILAALLVYALPSMRPRPVAQGDLVIRVEGEQFWWRITYRPAGARDPFVSANEIRIPVGRAVSFELTSTDVIHSFWIPGLAGKMDMIPGRITRLPVRAERPGRFRGVCAEFCGLSHALMAFDVIAMPAKDFDAWVARNRPRAATESEGGRLFARNGCGGCHGPSGIGPSLIDFADRQSLGAGIMVPTVPNIAAFIRNPQAAKPGSRMPSYPQLSDAEAESIAVWLRTKP